MANSDWGKGRTAVSLHETVIPIYSSSWGIARLVAASRPVACTDALVTADGIARQVLVRGESCNSPQSDAVCA
jgi:hypothetical protein